MKTKNIHLSPVVQIFKNEQGVANQQVDGIYFAGQYNGASTPSHIRIQLKMDRCETTLLDGSPCT